MKSFIEPLESRIAPATLAISPVTVSHQEGDTDNTISFHVHLAVDDGESLPSGDTVVHYAAVSGSAIADTDFVSVSGDLTFASGETDKDISVTIKGNTTPEGDRAFTVALSNPTNGVTLKSGEESSAVTIIDDDYEVGITGGGNVTEGNLGDNNTADFTVSLTSGTALSHDVVVNLTYIDGTATQLGPGKDYNASSVTQVIIPAGQTSATFHVPVIGDMNVGADENFTVAIGSVTGAKTGGSSSAGVTIVNDDDPNAAPKLSISGPSGPVAEGGKATFTFSLDQPSESDVVVHYTAGVTGDTATVGVDYTAPSGTLTIPSGQTSATVDVDVLQDNLAEHSSESFRLKIDSVQAHNGNSIQLDADTAVAVIAADPLPTITIGNLTVLEGNANTKIATFDVHLSSAADQDITIAYDTAAHTGDGISATEGVDYVGAHGTLTIHAGETVGHIDVTINGDTTAETDEKFDLVLSNAVNGDLGGATKTATATIQNDDTIFSIVNPADGGSSISVDEAAGTVTFKVVRNDGSVPGSVHVMSKNGVAAAGVRGSVSGSDYDAFDQVLDFGVGETEKTVTITLHDDDVYEGAERFTVELSQPTNGILDPDHTVGTVLLGDNDAAPVITITPTASATEGSPLHFNVTLSRASEIPVVVSFYTTDGVTSGSVFGATAGSDYNGFTQASPGTITIQPGSTTGTIDISTIQDIAVEHDEVFSVTLKDTSIGTLGSATTATGTIVNDDTTAVHVTKVSNATILEGSDPSAPKTLVFTIELDRPIDSTFPLQFSTVNGTGANAAIAGQDYVAVTNANVTIPANHLTPNANGKYEVTASVQILGDSIQENDETFSIKLSTPSTNSAAVVFDQSVGTGTIQNDDLGIHVTDVQVQEGNAGTTTAVFTITLDRALTAGQSVTMDYKTVDGTATSTGSVLGTGVKDFQAITTQSLSFDSAHTFRTVSVTVYGDQVSEGLDLSHLYETFSLQLSNAKFTASSGGTATDFTLSDTEAVAKILDDDGGANKTTLVSVTPVNATQAEGDTTGKTASFKLNLSTAIQHDVVVTYTSSVITTGGTAVTETHTATIPAGQTSVNVDVAYDGDQTVGHDKVAQVTVTDAKLAQGQTDVTTVAVTTSAAGKTAKTDILDDDAIIKLVAPADAAEGAAGASHVVNYTVSVTDANNQPVTLDHDVVVSYSTADGTAKAGSDYTAAASGAKVTIAKGSSSANIPVTVLGDSLAGDDETFSVNVNSVTGAHLATTPTTVTSKILNDDGALPKIKIESVSGDEGTDLIFTVKLVDANGNPVAADSDLAVNFHTTDGTATAGTDYTAVAASSEAGTVTVPAGKTGAQFAVAAYTTTSNGSTTKVNDTANEGAETFNIVVDGAKFASSTGNVDAANITSGTGTINPSDLPTLVFDASSLRLAENGTDQHITVKLDGGATATNAISFTLTTSGGTATAGTDYTALTDATFTIQPGQNHVDIPLSVVNDTLLEHDETIGLTLKLAANAPAQLPQNAASLPGTAVIGDDEITYTIHKDGDASGASVTVDETAGFAFFKVTRSDASAAGTVHWTTVDGTAKSSGSNIDFRAVSGDLSFKINETEKTIAIPIVDDKRYEGSENFTVVLSNPTNGVVSSQGTGTVTINDNEALPVVTISAAKDVKEGNTGTKQMTFTVSLSAPNDVQDVVVNYSTSDVSNLGGLFTATAGEDYTAKTGSITFAKGETSKTITIDVLSDDTFDSALRETLQVNLSLPTTNPGAAFTGGATQIFARGAIIDDDPLPVLTVSAASATEGSNLGFTVSLDRPSDLPVHLSYYTTDVTAKSGVDFAGAGKTSPQFITLEKGETSKQIVIATTNDDIAEGDETFQLHVAKAPGFYFPAKFAPKSTNLTGTILDDDHAFVTINDVQVQEGDSGTTNAVFHVNLSSVASKDVLVKYSTVDGSAMAGTDYTARTGTLLIPAGSTSGDIIIPVHGDLAQEFTTAVANAFETFQVKLSSATNAELARDTGTGTIVDEDTGATLNIVAKQVVEGTPSGAGDVSSTTMVFVPTLTHAAATDVTFTMSTAVLQSLVGSAKLGQDYLVDSSLNPAGLSFKILQGQTQPTGSFSGLTVTVLKDSAFEATESFLVKLNNVTGAIAGDTTAVGTIFNDDLSVSKTAVKWVDADGELVTLTTSKGDLTHAGFNFDSTTASVTKYGGRTLELLNLNAQEFLRANISITSKPQPGFPTNLPGLVQDGSVNVGTIRSNNLTSTDDLLELQGVDLGKVVVGGNLNSIVVGDIYNDPSLQALTVKSFGVQAPGETSLAIGDIKSLTVTGDFKGNLQVKGNKNGSINHIRIYGNIDGTGVNPNSPDASVGSINVKGAIRDAIVGGIIGGATDGSGSITAQGSFGKIVTLTVKGDVKGGSGFGSGEIFSGNNIDTLVVNGSILAGSGEQSGFVFANSKIGVMRVDGNLANGSLINPSITTGGVGESGSIVAGNVGTLKIGGSILGGRVVATGAISALTVDGDVKNSGSNDAFVIAGGVGVPVALPSILVKGQATNAHFLAGYFRDIQSDTDTSNPNAPVTTTRTFYTPANADAQIGTIQFDGAVQNIDIVAGSMPGAFTHNGSSLNTGFRSYGDGKFGTSDDVVINDVNTGIGLIDEAGVNSRIASIIFNGGILNNATEHGIVAQQIGSVTIDGDLQPLVGSNSPVEVQAGSKFYYHKVL